MNEQLTYAFAISMFFGVVGFIFLKMIKRFRYYVKEIKNTNEGIKNTNEGIKNIDLQVGFLLRREQENSAGKSIESEVEGFGGALRTSGIDSPIFVATIFKSGTKLLEKIISLVTKCNAIYPIMDAGSDYLNEKHIRFQQDSFFIWHHVPVGPVAIRLVAERAKPIFLVRNIYDLLVSQYWHFALDVDADIGRTTKTLDYFSDMTSEEGIALLISGSTSQRFDWRGFGFYLKQIQEMLLFSQSYPCQIVVYDRLVNNKRDEIKQLASFLMQDISEADINRVIEQTSLNAMRDERVSATGSGKHFRKGLPGDHMNILQPWHYEMINHACNTYAPKLHYLCENMRLQDITDKRGEKAYLK